MYIHSHWVRHTRQKENIPLTEHKSMINIYIHIQKKAKIMLIAKYEEKNEDEKKKLRSIS